jgi:hypothetical protein
MQVALAEPWSIPILIPIPTTTGIFGAFSNANVVRITRADYGVRSWKYLSGGGIDHIVDHVRS